jgi:hypothetical protein
MTDRATKRATKRADACTQPDKAAAARQRARDRAADDDLPRKSGAPAKHGGVASS